MRQLVLSLLIFSVFSQAYAFKDIVVLEKTRQLLKTIPDVSVGVRLQKVEEFKNELYEQLNTMPIPNTPEEDEEYASITEFSGYVNMIDTTSISKAKCDNTNREILMSSNSQGEVLPEAKLALHIVSALCK